jgi:hypothetical protein
LDSFEKGAAEIEVSGTDWNCSDAYAALQQDVAAHVRGLELQKVRKAEATASRWFDTRPLDLLSAQLRYVVSSRHLKAIARDRIDAWTS